MPVNSGYANVPAMAEERDENLHNLDVMSAFGLEKEGDDQNGNKSKSKATKEKKSAEKQRSTKRRRFAVVDTEDLDALVEDSQAKKTKQATQWAESVFTGRSQLRFEMGSFTQVFPTSLIYPKKILLQTRL